MKWFYLIIFALVSISSCNNAEVDTLRKRDKVKVTYLEGSVKFTDEYQPKAKVCIPAAYTDCYGKIEGQYRINGVTYGRRSLKECTSIHLSKGLVISRDWVSGNGFQQHVLVKNGKVRSFRDKRRYRRRALCSNSSDPGALFIIESKRKMTMNEFANEVAKHSTNAVNLDMGRWGYGWIGKKTLSSWAVLFKHRQTNWIVCD